MFTRKVRCVVAIIIVAASLAACASKEELKGRFTGRWGPNPTIQADEFQSIVANQGQVINFIAGASGVGELDNEKRVVVAKDDWIRIAEWGFNVGRQDCEIYMDNLFRMSREKERTDTILTGLSTAAVGIVSATSHSQKALSILAAAFGLSIVANDAVFQSYLFTQAPGLVANKVKDLQGAYRDAIETAYAKNKTSIQTPEQAFNAIQGYYSICLPQSIEGTLLQAVSNTSATMPKSTGQTTTTKSKAGTTTTVNNPANKSPTLTQ